MACPMLNPAILIGRFKFAEPLTPRCLIILHLTKYKYIQFTIHQI
jgi:hypothetical protein